MARKKDTAEDVAESLGGEPGPEHRIALYVPSGDKKGEETGEQRRWVLEAARLLLDACGQATVSPPLEGAWSGDGRTVWERPVVVYAFLQAGALRAAVPRLREFLHRLGRETGQAEVAFELDGRLFRIRAFDAP